MARATSVLSRSSRWSEGACAATRLRSRRSGMSRGAIMRVITGGFGGLVTSLLVTMRRPETPRQGSPRGLDTRRSSGSQSGHAGHAFVSTLANKTDRFTKLLAVVTPNLPAKPDTLLFNKVTIKNATQAVQMFGPAQAAVARAVVDSVSSGIIPRDKVDDYCILVGVFIHWEAKNDKKIYDFNYRAVKESIERALKGQPKIDQVISQAKTASHPFAGGADKG